MKTLNVVACACAAALGAGIPGSATTLQGPKVVTSSARTGSVHGGARTVLLLTRSGSRIPANVNGPSGCVTSESPYFIGISGQSNYARNYSGVLAGIGNESCDSLSAISAGEYNRVGGDNTTEWSTVVSGYSNELESSYSGFIGGGSYNLIGYAPPQGQTPATSAYSAIVDGYSNQIAGAYSFIGSGAINSVVGASNAFIGAGEQNAISGSQSSISSGQSNAVAGFESSIDSGSSNQITADNASIVGGMTNRIATQYSFIGGGQANQILSTPALYGAISGGYNNVVNAEYGMIGGGQSNTVGGAFGSIPGGYLNTASGPQAAIGGGYANVASGKNAAIPGGTTNVASATNTFAAGTKSTAGYSGSFVWSDYISGANGVSAKAPNQFVARATGGFYLYSSATLTGVALAPGSGAWSTLSDRNVKSGIATADDARILAKLAALPVSTWSYKAQGTGVRHLGPMAQDFRAAFGLGEDDRHISTVDEEGVALAAIKALAAAGAAKDREIAALRVEKDRQIAQLRTADDAKFAALEMRLAALERSEHLQVPGSLR